MTRSKILDYIQSNRVSSTEVADALGKTGAIAGLRPLTAHQHVVGSIKHVKVTSPTNFDVYKVFDQVEPNDFLYVDCKFQDEIAIFGDIACKYLFLYKKISGLAVNGYLRDAHRLLKERYPIWCRGVTPIGAVNASDPSGKSTAFLCQSSSDSILVGDDSGVVLIPKIVLDEEFFARLQFLEVQEDCWYFCIDTLKWTPYETISQKQYLTKSDVVPKHMRDALFKEPTK